MLSSVYFPLFLVLVSPTKEYSIFYLAADLQSPEMFKPRTPLSATARRAGWQGVCIIHKQLRITSSG
ncbi:DpnI domain-containing protein [Ochrobactrum quorumnocens]|uniref:DpnI domain-containing protein n=1 Tax=Ochrobactrum quorumnocens TaxID=271865 RepID=UPI00350E4FE4